MGRPAGPPPAAQSGSASTLPIGPFLGLPVVATRNHHAGPYGVVATTTQNTRISHVLCSAITEVRLLFVNWSGGETSGVNALTITAGLEFPLGTVYPVTFGGSNTLVLDPDGIRLSDPVPIDAPAGTTIYSRTFCSAPTSFPVIRSAYPATNEASENGPALANKAQVTTAIAVPSFPTAGYCPSAVVGVPKGAGTRNWVAIIGDSIPNGQGDFFEQSYITRALEGVPVPFVQITKGGESAQTFAALATSRRRRQLAGGAPIVFDEYGTNDANGGRTLAQLQADKLTIWFAFAGRGARVYTSTVTTRPSASSDGWTTLAGQTANVSVVGANYNAWLRDGAPIDATSLTAVAAGTVANTLRAGSAGHPVAVHALAPKGYLEVADVFESGRDTGKIRVPGVSGTADTSNGTNTLLNVTGAGWAVGQIVVGAGIPSQSLITSIVGSTITLVDTNKNPKNATATATGVSIAAAHTVDGIHPSPALHALMAAAVTPALFA